MQVPGVKVCRDRILVDLVLGEFAHQSRLVCCWDHMDWWKTVPGSLAGQKEVQVDFQSQIVAAAWLAAGTAAACSALESQMVDLAQMDQPGQEAVVDSADLPEASLRM